MIFRWRQPTLYKQLNDHLETCMAISVALYDIVCSMTIDHEFTPPRQQYSHNCAQAATLARKLGATFRTIEKLSVQLQHELQVFPVT